MANRRFGVGGPQRGGGGGGIGGGGAGGGFNRNFLQPSNVSPWQGGVAPGNSNNSIQAAQLALALTNLIQQTQPNQDGPPSLLSMNPSPGFFNPNQDNYNNNNNNMNNRGFNNQVNRGRQDFRRNDSFNKNRGGAGGGAVGGWRSNDNNRNNNRVGSSANNHHSSGGFFKNPRYNNKDRSANSSRTSHSSSSTQDTKSKDRDTKDKKQTSDKTAVKTEKTESAASDLDDTRDDEKTDKKRDWKQEKKPEDKSSGAVAKSSGGKSANDSVDLTEDAEGGKTSAAKVNTKYDGLPNSYLHCFVCNKSMWDGESFQNHVRGKAHKQMITSLEDSFQITVNILRENMRVAEERKVIEMQRMQRNRRFHHKNNDMPSHCNMCNHKFLGKIVVHRQSEGHQRLKRFLHPNCKACDAEFPSRMEWVDHLFTHEHLLTSKKAMDEKSTEPGEYKVEQIVEFDIQPIMDEAMQNEDDSPVTELTDDLSNLYNRIPVYKSTRCISTASIKPTAGFICEICQIFMITEEEAETHMRTEVHYHKFMSVVKAKFLRNNEDAKKKDGKKEAKKRKCEDTVDDEEDEEAEEEEEESKKEDETAESADIYDPFAAGNEAEAMTEVKEETTEETTTTETPAVETMKEEEENEEEAEEEEEPETAETAESMDTTEPVAVKTVKPETTPVVAAVVPAKAATATVTPATPATVAPVVKATPAAAASKPIPAAPPAPVITPSTPAGGMRGPKAKRGGGVGGAAVTPAVTGAGTVRNGAGPKSKRGRK